jgi:hypothetical protein
MKYLLLDISFDSKKGINDIVYAVTTRKGKVLESASMDTENFNLEFRLLKEKYGNIALVTYNLATDMDVLCANGFDASIFSKQFCLWQMALGNVCNTQNYRQFAFSKGFFTSKGTIQTTLEVVHFYLENTYVRSNHDSFVDIVLSVSVLKHICKKENWQNNIAKYNRNLFLV